MAVELSAYLLLKRPGTNLYTMSWSVLSDLKHKIQDTLICRGSNIQNQSASQTFQNKNMLPTIAHPKLKPSQNWNTVFTEVVYYLFFVYKNYFQPLRKLCN